MEIVGAMMQISQSLLQRVCVSLKERTGLLLGEGELPRLHHALLHRSKALRTSPEAYAELLQADMRRSAEEWNNLLPLLTTGETFFFRDRGQVAVLKERLLPELLARRASERTLRIWSAGCSTGEEAYTLAMLVDQVLPTWQQWDVVIYGTDINRHAIERAREGIYTDWSFRMVEPQIRGSYFRQHSDGWEIDRRFLQMVQFQVGNLVADPFPSPQSGLYDFDLILCRNVFIYFSTTTIVSVLEKFARSLRDDGYLMCGHVEVPFGTNLSLQARAFPEATVYCRGSHRPARTASLSSTTPAVRMAPSRTRQTARVSSPPPRMADSGAPILTVELPDLEALLSEGEYARVISEAKRCLVEQLQSVDLHVLMAEAFASLGQYEVAEASCRAALAIDSFDERPYFLLAQIAQTHRNDSTGAKHYLRQVQYLKPSGPGAYLELAEVCELEGDVNRARKLQAIGVELLRDLPPDTLVLPYREMTAGELLAQLSRISEVDSNGGEMLAVPRV